MKADGKIKKFIKAISQMYESDGTILTTQSSNGIIFM